VNAGSKQNNRQHKGADGSSWVDVPGWWWYCSGGGGEGGGGGGGGLTIGGRQRNDWKNGSWC
jgi:hypothetical protein